MSSYLFVDSRVPDIEFLLAGLDDEVEVVLLDAGADGIEQVLLALHGIRDLDSVQIASHGASGALLLGSTVIDEASLHARQAAGFF